MNDRSLYAYNYYLQRGYSPAAAAGIVGNLKVESGSFADDVLSGQRRGDSGSAFGAAQWRGARLEGLHNYAQQNGLDFRSLDAQLGYVDHEMRTGSDAGAGVAFQKLQTAQSPAEAAQAFMQHYERPNADPSINGVNQRMAYANSLAGVPNDKLPTSYAQNLPASDASAGIAGLAPTGAAALPTVQEAAAADPMSGVFGLMLQGVMSQPKQVAAAPPPQMERRADTRSIEEKMAATSQTPDVYLDRMRRRSV